MAKFYTPGKISENIRETPEGFLLCLGVPIARTGWQEYGEGETPLKCGPDGIIKIHRSSDEVFRPQTIASFQGKSITIRHPENFVAPDNWQDLTYGTAQNVRKAVEKDDDGEESLIADLLITEKMAIGLVRNGLRQVSCGYEAEYEQTGEGEGKQIKIIGNHVALVEEGRAGSSYAITDHKRKVSSMEKTLIEKLKARFGAKVVDEAMAEEKKEAKDAPTVANESYDELKGMMKDMAEKLESGLKSIGAKDEKEEPKKDDDDDKAKDEEESKKEEKSKDEPASMEDRMKALEAAVSKLLESKAGDEESEDDDFEESSMTGDAARAEILSPGIKLGKKEKAEDMSFKSKALTAAYATEDGKEVIDTLIGGKKLTLDSNERVSMLFTAASEILSAKRGTGLESTKNPLGFEVRDENVVTGAITAEKMNEINAAHWASRK